MTRRRLTCVLLDDHEVVLESIADYLRSEDLDVVGQARSAADAVHLIGELKPDVAVLDYELPEADGVQVARALTVASPLTATILFTGAAGTSIVEVALKAGIRGVVLKESPPRRLLRAINAAVRGDTYIDPRLRPKR